MQDELTIEGLAGALGEGTTTEPAATTGKRRRLRQALGAYIGDRREGIICVLCAVAVVVAIYGTLFGSVALWKHNGRLQAVVRAQMMDGRIYRVTPTGWNLMGDTILRVEDESGKSLGWVAMHHTNPFTLDVNPLSLAFSEKRYDPTPSRVRVRARYRPQAWEYRGEYEPSANGNYTGDYLVFEQIGGK